MTPVTDPNPLMSLDLDELMRLVQAGQAQRLGRTLARQRSGHVLYLGEERFVVVVMCDRSRVLNGVMTLDDARQAGWSEEIDGPLLMRARQRAEQRWVSGQLLAERIGVGCYEHLNLVVNSFTAEWRPRRFRLLKLEAAEVSLKDAPLIWLSDRQLQRAQESFESKVKAGALRPYGALCVTNNNRLFMEVANPITWLGALEDGERMARWTLKDRAVA